jgi:hypothetical protein
MTATATSVVFSPLFPILIGDGGGGWRGVWESGEEISLNTSFPSPSPKEGIVLAVASVVVALAVPKLVGAR